MVTIQDIYAALVNDVSRNEMIANDIVRAVDSGRCPLLLTGRTEHLHYFATKLAGAAGHVFALKGGMGKKQRRATAAALASVPENESRVILATGGYIGEGFDDARLDTLFLAMPISWKGTLQQYVGRLDRLHDNKRFVQVYDYVDNYVLMLARMYEGLWRDWLWDRAGKVSTRSLGDGTPVDPDRQVLGVFALYRALSRLYVCLCAYTNGSNRNPASFVNPAKDTPAMYCMVARGIVGFPYACEPTWPRIWKGPSATAAIS
jgi:hypothetical protein